MNTAVCFFFTGGFKRVGLRMDTEKRLFQQKLITIVGVREQRRLRGYI